MSFTFKNHPSSTTLLLFLTPIILITLTYFILGNNDFHLESLFTVSSCKTSSANTIHNDTNLRIFMGIITMPQLHERRHLLRSIYTLQRPILSNVEINIRFMYCGHELNETIKMFLSLDMTLYNDIILLDCTENMNDGKTYTYFSSLPSIIEGRYDYAIKADDDTYFRLDNLAKYLLDKPREDFYSGMELSCVGIAESCGGKDKTYMAGLGYILSWDIVKWIAESDVPKNNLHGIEDFTLGKWLNMGNKGKNRYNGCPDHIYDYKGDLNDKIYRHDFVSDTVAVHQLKKNLYWARTLKYFNVTHSLRA